jgi:hypothetical protein
VGTPAFEEVAARLAGRVRVARLDVPNARIRRTPPIVLFVSGAPTVTVVDDAPDCPTDRRG